ncbi:MAG: HlyD family secretion protein [Rhodopirellula sp. JB044]|uniref:HlyD family secretion protein n=1 Tax=Rhodopirellula sp. JB044 TaxID=3342844 RepID=UPI003709EFCF
MSKRIVLIVVVALIAGGGWIWWRFAETQVAANALPPGFVSGNGRIEAVQVDVSTKYAGRVVNISVEEGDMVKPGQILAQLDTAELQATLEKAVAQHAEAMESLVETDADIASCESALLLAANNLERSKKLLQRNAMSREEYDTRKNQQQKAVAALKSAMAHRRTAERAIEAANAEVKRIQTQISDYTLDATVSGRVLYRLAEEGEVLSAGGKVLTLLDLSNVYMEIYVPSHAASQISIHTEARVQLDVAPQYLLPAEVVFVSPEAQFTPKQVETLKERDKLMFRVKVQIARELVKQHIDKVKTGVRGVAYVRLDEHVPWPEHLRNVFPKTTLEGTDQPASGFSDDTIAKVTSARQR